MCEALGISCGLSFKAQQMQAKVQKTLRTRQLLLVIDCAQWLFPVSDYRYKLPDRINWVLNDLAQYGVPIVMIADSKIFDTIGFVEARTGWNRNQLLSELDGIVELPAGLEVEDVRTVAAALLYDGDGAAQCKLADYMIKAPAYLNSGEPAAQRARRIAASHKHNRVTLADVTEAVESWLRPSLKDMDAALKRADAARDACQSRSRNWRPDTAAQIAAKKGKKRNPIITSSDLRAAPIPQPGSKRAGAAFGRRQSGRAAAVADFAVADLAAV
jgi:hypothetical protein